MSNPHWTFGYYVTAWPRFPPYLIGILFGWLLHQTKNTKIIISRVIFKMIIARRSMKIKDFCLVLRYLDRSGYWMDISYHRRFVYHLRIDSLLRWKSSARNERNNKSLLRRVSSSCLVNISRLAHLCLCPWLWRTSESVSIVESVHPTEPTYLRRLFDSSRISVHVVISFKKTNLFYSTGLLSVILWSSFRIAPFGFFHLGDGGGAIPQFGKTNI